MTRTSTAVAAHTQDAVPPLSIRPLAISAAARAALTPGVAMVLAGHRLGASLALPGTDDAVFMSAPGIGLLPAHVIVRARDLERVLHALETDGRKTADTARTLPLRLDIQGVRTFRPRLAPDPAAMRSARALANIDCIGRWLRAHPAPLGLGLPAAELLAPAGCWRQGMAALRRDTPPAEAFLRSLIGRGAGTTPAGDDFLLGALAYAWAARGKTAAAVTATRRLRTELPALTSAVGATYIRAGIRGEFGSHLIAWVRALAHARPARALALAGRVAGHGASSGYDTLAGFVAAAEDAASAPQPARLDHAVQEVAAR